MEMGKQVLGETAFRLALLSLGGCLRPLVAHVETVAGQMRITWAIYTSVPFCTEI